MLGKMLNHDELSEDRINCVYEAIIIINRLGRIGIGCNE